MNKEIFEGYYEDTLTEIKYEYKRIQENIENVTDDILSNTNVDELNENFQELVSKLMQARQLLDTSRKQTFFGKVLSYVPFVKEKIDDFEINRSSLKDISDDLKRIQDEIIKDTEEKFQYYKEIYVVNEQAKKDIENQIKELKKLKPRNELEKIEIDNMIRSLKSLNVINTNNLEECRLQIQSFASMKQKAEEMSPQIQSMLKMQFVIASQNNKMKNIKQNYDVVKEVLNEFIILNDKNTKEAIKDAIELSQDNLIEAKTVKTLTDSRLNFKKELDSLVNQLEIKKEELNKEITSYIKTVENTPLLNGNIKPRLKYEKY